jgi:competence protein ComEC
MIGTILLLAPKKFPAKWLGLVGLLPLVLYRPDKPAEDTFWFTLLDVGQGLSAVIQTKNHTLVFDTGPKFSDSFDTGSAVVSPFLTQQGINHIDNLIISHGDNDHIGGAASLIDEIKTNTILSSVPERLPNASHCIAGQSWQWDGVMFSVLHPYSDDQASENNLSCVLKVSTKNTSILLTGDIESHAEKLLVQRYGSKLASTLIVAPHHGSNTSSSYTFIHVVNPEIVLFPIGYRNRYGFPKENIVNRYSIKNRTLLDSAQYGAIQYKFGPQTVSGPILWRKQAKRIWTAVN